MSAFGLVNWLATLAAAAWLWRVYSRERFLLIKPSLLVIAYAHLLFQWPLAFASGTYEHLLPQPYTLSLLIHGYVLSGLALATRTMRGDAALVWSRLLAGAERADAVSWRVIACLAVAVAVVVNMHLHYVPYDETGLHAALFDPASISQARENTLKLLKDPVPRYAFSLMATSVAHLLTGLIVIAMWPRGDSPDLLRRFVLALLFCCLCVAVFLAAEKARVVYLLIVACAVLLWRDGLAFKPARIAGCVALLLLASCALVILRHWQLPMNDWPAALGAYVQATLVRIFPGPLEVGSWYVHYAQTHGPIGIAAFPKLAALFGINPVDAPNMIGLAYAATHYGVNKGGFLPTVSASAGYLLTYYGYLGIASLPLSIAGLLLLDLALKVYLRLDATMLLACIAAITQQSLMFVQSDYTVSLVSHGFVPTLLLALGLSRLASREQRASRPPATLQTGR